MSSPQQNELEPTAPGSPSTPEASIQVANSPSTIPGGNAGLHTSASSSAGDSRLGENASPKLPSSGSPTSELQLSHASVASDLSADRVFPIRSVVRVDTPNNFTTTDDSPSYLSDAESRGPGIPVHFLGGPRAEPTSDPRRIKSGPSPPASSPHPPRDRPPMSYRKRTFSGPYSSVQADAARKGSSAPLDIDLGSSDREDAEYGVISDANTSGGSVAVSDSQSISLRLENTDNPHVTTRFTHVETEEGHLIIEVHDSALQRCEDEPIHIPGAVQSFGVLLAMREESDGRFVVHYVSENSEKLLGYNPQQLFSFKSFLDILTEEQQDNLLDHIDFIRDEDADPAVDGPEVFSLSLRARNSNRTSKLWCAIHINPAHPDLIICEFEKEYDQQYPLRPLDDDVSPGTPYDSLHGNPTLEEIEESTEILSRPLRVLRSARKKRGEQGTMQVFDIMSQVQDQLSSATTLETFLKVLVGIVKELTGFHRVMMYQFDSSFNGKVVAELVDTTKTVDLYHGLHFPASDIPRQARELYKLNKVRLLYDRELESARIVCQSREDLEVPLDMSHAYLRALSPIHLKYLGNMGVRASMSISINAFNELWGLLACHSYGPHGMRVSFPIRKMCRLVGDTASRNIERLSYASRLQARKLINAAPTDGNPAGYIIASSEDLLRLFDADFGLLSIKGETKIFGVVEQSQEALAMLEYLRMRKLTSVVASQDVGDDFPDLRYEPGFQVIAGLLYVPLSVGGHDFIVFFRKGQVKQVKWAGNPYEKRIREGTASLLEPRTSFKIWQETMVGKCHEWAEEQVETAAVLCLVYGKFIEVWRQKEAALQSSKLRRILLANSAHEVRTPLNAIINYLEIALEGSLDQETRDNLARSHSASKSLIYTINDLLDLTKTEEGQQHLINFQTFELPLCIKEATDPFRIDAERKGIEYQVDLHPGLPRFVHGDGRRVRQAVSNITANAVAHTASGYVKVDVLVTDVKDREVVEIIVTDSGAGMNPKQLDALFQELEQVSTEEPDPIPDLSLSPEPKSSELRTLGLGLAVVARIVRNMDGQLRLKSSEGQGSRIVVQLPFQIPSESPGALSSPGEMSPTTAVNEDPVSKVKSLKTAQQDEVLVFDASGISIGVKENETHVREGIETPRSVGNDDNSVKMEADRLMNDMQSTSPSKKGDRETLSSNRSRSPDVGFIIDVAEVWPCEQVNPMHAHHVHDQSQGSIKTSEIGGFESSAHSIEASPEPAEQFYQPAQLEPEGLLCNSSDVSQVPASSASQDQVHALQILIAEDDPINLKVLKKRLERAGHEVHHAVNGEDCATVYREKSPSFDVILMDMQMPIVDGLTSTKLIRSIEQSAGHAGHSPLAAICGRIPIFAVSASLVEREREKYISSGFDGWILKPIDFKRLSTLLEGIRDTTTRSACLYTPGDWECGGWFGLPHGGNQDIGESMASAAADENKEADFDKQRASDTTDVL